MRILSDDVIERLLKDLDRKGIKKFQKVLELALQDYTKDPSLIPKRIVVQPKGSDSTHLFMPCFNGRVGIKSLCGSREGFKGSVSIMNEENGDLIGILNAMTLTAFRTALASTIPLMKFFDTTLKNQEISVFGNGLQAYWHIRLTLLLFYDNISDVQIIVRSINEKTKTLRDKIALEFPEHSVRFTEIGNHDLMKSSVIYGCIPSTEPSILLTNLAPDKPVYISLIGSYKPHMREVDDDLIQFVKSRGKIIVDSKEHTLLEAGELIRNNIGPEDLVEIGELAKGISICEDITLVKIVGLAIMDISVGTEILKLSERKAAGTVVDF